MSGDEELCSNPTSSIASSNKGFQLLKKCGWTEGTGLGVAEQGRLEPLEAHVKNNKRGLGAEIKKKKMLQRPEASISKDTQSTKKAKALSKRMKKMLEHEKLLQEKEFEMAFRREFWPDNV